MSNALTFLKNYQQFGYKIRLETAKTYSDSKTILSLFKNLLTAIRSSLHNRTITKNVLLRFHNKVKHGMMVQDYGNDLYIRDLKIKINNKGRVIRRNRNLYLRIDEEKAKKMVGTIEVNLAAIHFIVILFMSIYGYIIKKKKESGKKFSKKEMLFLQESLKDYSKQ